MLASRLSPKNAKRIREVFSTEQPSDVVHALLVAARSAWAKPLERTLDLLQILLRRARSRPGSLALAVEAFLAANPAAPVARKVGAKIGSEEQEHVESA